MPVVFLDSIEHSVDRILAEVGKDIVLGIPMGIGKPNPLVNALYRRVKQDQSLTLKIVTALSLVRPRPASDLERRFLGPIFDRVFGNYPDLEYALDMRRDALPPNVKVFEFFMKTGDFLKNKTAQQHYIYSNYTHAARDLLLQGVNLLMQEVSSKRSDGKLSLSLSSNPDITMDLLELARANRIKVLKVGMINDALPFMPNDAEVSPDLFDLVCTDPAGTHDLFAPPSMAITLTDYAIGLQCASLVDDGGTLQIGIGSLGDAIACSLILRDRQSARFGEILRALGGGATHGLSQTNRFEKGLYGCSEMLVDGFLQLIRAGIIRREVFADAAVQKLINDGRITARLDADCLQALREADLIDSPLSRRDVAYLKRTGIFKPEVGFQDGAILVDGKRLKADIDSAEERDALAASCMPRTLPGGLIMHGGFFIGPRSFYQGLRELPPEILNKVCMGRIAYINALYGQEDVAKLQRKDARFINTTMKVTLLGAAGSDSLESGQVVSGVGGQYNFVAMAHALPDARSILILRSTHTRHGKVVSNIVWEYANVTIPRHLRDIVVTEYGIADLRGQSDATVIKRMLAICDSRFQDELLATAKKSGKVEASYEIPETQRHNLPQMVTARLEPWRSQGLLPELPFGTDLTEVELQLAKALKKAKAAVRHPLELVRLLLRGASRSPQDWSAPLERMGLYRPASLKDRLIRTLLLGCLCRRSAAANQVGALGQTDR